ncbi:MAG: DUF3108 domain-containing protein [Verrucomicrobia bacterium]|nr:DUF3108 domain-containing protein [Verrucomicrobiota bacterium]
MIFRATPLLMAGIFFGPPSLGSPPLRDGERLSYRVSWAVVPGAGEINIAARQESAADRPTLVVSARTSTRRLARLLLPFDAEGTSVFDLRTGRLLSLSESSVLRNKTSDHQVTFDYATRQASYTGGKTPGQTRLLPIPVGDPTDLIMGLLQTRTWDLPAGSKRDALVLFGTEFYELTIHHARIEDVRTPLGTHRAVVLEPRMEKTPPKGMFKRGSTVRVWIAQDERRLPVKFEVEFAIGTGTATLVAYEGPATAAPPR